MFGWMILLAPIQVCITGEVRAADNLTASSPLKIFKNALERDGFTVQKGTFQAFDLVARCCQGEIPCNYNNPTSPYAVYTLPQSPGQKGQKAEGYYDGWPVTWRLRPDEAVIFVGKTPPPASYFGFESYLASRYNGTEQDRIPILGSLGDTLNHLTIKTRCVEGAVRPPFDCETMIVTTADKGIDERVRKAARRAGYPPTMINTQVIPADLVKLGVLDEADTLMLLARVALFDDEQAGTAYMNNPGATVFRVTPGTPAELEPFAVPRIRVRGTGKTELDLMGSLNDLRQAILAAYGVMSATMLDTTTWIEEGLECIQRETMCFADNRDTTYLKTSEFFLPDDPNVFVIVYGVNHQLVGKATYSSFSVYGTQSQVGVAAVPSVLLQGSADDYIPGHPSADYLYAWKIARSCGSDLHCLEIPSGCPGVAMNESAFLGFRAYLERATHVGPAYSELLWDRAIRFTPGP